MQFSHSRLDDLDLLAAEAAGLPGVRIEPGDREDRRAGTKIAAQRRVRDTSGVDDGGRGQGFDRSAQREMNRNRDYAQPRAHQHHDRSRASLRELGEVLGMAGMVKAGSIEAGLL